jgi:hypothetical protein
LCQAGSHIALRRFCPARQDIRHREIIREAMAAAHFHRFPPALERSAAVASEDVQHRGIVERDRLAERVAHLFCRLHRFLGVPFSSSPDQVLRVIGNIGLVAVLALPLSMGVAILKYRLYDIDRILSRTVAYAIITGLLVGVYAGLVLLATQVLRFSSPVAVAASTLAAVALFTPVRRRVQRAVDRRFNRARYDADQTVTRFAARLQDAVDLDSVRADLQATVSGSLQPARL